MLIRRLLRRSGPLFLPLLLGSALATYAASLTLFIASYNGTTVRVDWEVSTEADVTGFELARKSATETSFTQVGTVAANGQRRYQFLDANVYRTVPGSSSSSSSAPQASTAAGGPYTYRLTVRGAQADQSYLTVLVGTPSAVQRSWGTIKSMFR